MMNTTQNKLQKKRPVTPPADSRESTEKSSPSGKIVKGLKKIGSRLFGAPENISEFERGKNTLISNQVPTDSDEKVVSTCAAEKNESEEEEHAIKFIESNFVQITDVNTLKNLFNQRKREETRVSNEVDALVAQDVFPSFAALQKQDNISSLIEDRIDRFQVKDCIDRSDDELTVANSSIEDCIDHTEDTAISEIFDKLVENAVESTIAPPTVKEMKEEIASAKQVEDSIKDIITTHPESSAIYDSCLEYMSTYAAPTHFLAGAIFRPGPVRKEAKLVVKNHITNRLRRFKSTDAFLAIVFPPPEARPTAVQHHSPAVKNSVDVMPLAVENKPSARKIANLGSKWRPSQRLVFNGSLVDHTHRHKHLKHESHNLNHSLKRKAPFEDEDNILPPALRSVFRADERVAKFYDHTHRFVPTKESFLVLRGRGEMFARHLREMEEAKEAASRAAEGEKQRLVEEEERRLQQQRREEELRIRTEQEQQRLKDEEKRRVQEQRRLEEQRRIEADNRRIRDQEEQRLADERRQREEEEERRLAKERALEDQRRLAQEHEANLRAEQARLWQDEMNPRVAEAENQRRLEAERIEYERQEQEQEYLERQQFEAKRAEQRRQEALAFQTRWQQRDDEDDDVAMTDAPVAQNDVEMGNAHMGADQSSGYSRGDAPVPKYDSDEDSDMEMDDASAPRGIGPRPGQAAQPIPPTGDSYEQSGFDETDTNISGVAQIDPPPGTEASYFDAESDDDEYSETEDSSSEDHNEDQPAPAVQNYQDDNMSDVSSEVDENDSDDSEIEDDVRVDSSAAQAVSKQAQNQDINKQLAGLPKSARVRSALQPKSGNPLLNTSTKPISKRPKLPIKTSNRSTITTRKSALKPKPKATSRTFKTHILPTSTTTTYTDSRGVRHTTTTVVSAPAAVKTYDEVLASLPGGKSVGDKIDEFLRESNRQMAKEGRVPGERERREREKMYKKADVEGRLEMLCGEMGVGGQLG